MAQMHIDYDGMRSVAHEYDVQGGVVKDVIGVLQGRTNELMNIWEGAAEASFMDELASVRRLLDRVPNTLSEVALALRNTADKIEEAERAAAAEMGRTILSDNP